MDLWWSGKHAAHGGNVQVIAAPDGWPIWTSPVRPGREHDTTALRAHPQAPPLYLRSDVTSLDSGVRDAKEPSRGAKDAWCG